MSERPSFSPFWHRVRALRPRLRPHVQITRQHYRGRRWHVVHDPATNAFFRLNPVAHEFISLLDGLRTVEDIWKAALTRHADDALTQNEVIQLLSQLYSSNLLAADVPPETEQLLARGRERMGKKAKQQAIGLMYFRIRLFNPDRILTWLEPIFRPLIGRVGFILWAAWIILGLSFIVPHWDRLAGGFDSALAPSNWGWIMVVFVVLKLWHELGHGIICKRFGGQVPEFGAMMLVLVPAPYVDASSSWAFPSKWQRIAVGAGGMIFELAAAALAAVVWATTPDGSLIHQLSYNAMLTASISTVLFNANPLMKFDGYYILSDMLEVPNLLQRSNNMLKFLSQRFIYRVKDATPPTSSPDEASILLVYGVLGTIYRIFLFFSITLYVMGKLFAIGLFLAVWTAATWFILPIGAFIHWLATSPQLADKRPRAIFTTLVLVGLCLTLVGAVPMPDRRRAVGIVQSENRANLFFGAEGFVTKAHARAGQFVRKGDILVECDSDRLRAQRELAIAQLAEARAREGLAIEKDATAAQVAREYVRTLEEQLAFVDDRIARLTVFAPFDGVIVGTDPDTLVGSYVREGQPLCELVDESAMRVVAILNQTEGNWIKEAQDYNVQMRLASRPGKVVEGRTDRVIEAARRELPHSALGYSGGGQIETDRRDQTGRVSKQPVFTAYIKAEPLGTLANAEGTPLGRPGERVYLRFALPTKPLLFQWTDRLEKLLQGRARL